MAEVGGGSVCAMTVTTNSAVCPGLTNGATYLWAVAASNSAGPGPTSAVVFFTVNVATVPPAPTGLTPGGASTPGPTVTTLTPTLSWNASAGAATYTVAMSQVGGGSVCAMTVTTTSAERTALLQSPTHL